MENKPVSPPSDQDPDMLDLCNIDFAKELARIPLYFTEVSPDMEFVPYPKKRRPQPPPPPPPLEEEEVDFAEEFKKIPLCFIEYHQLFPQTATTKPSTKPRQLKPVATCNVYPVSQNVTGISTF
ncbi:hypothetical protein L6452_29332 [Arctium lappa]|uniref:Uncharacterized protein n=1 Tax=Arctium lappa TaxID=4217 RepID=A0ACB8ZHI9_ARCLA|nr:hypothetical protein L6452_29332 [Arctium lappa]